MPVVAMYLPTRDLSTPIKIVLIKTNTVFKYNHEYICYDLVELKVIMHDSFGKKTCIFELVISCLLSISCKQPVEAGCHPKHSSFAQ